MAYKFLVFLAVVLPLSAQTVSWKQLPANLLNDQKRIWKYPLDAANGKHWLPAVGVIAATGALIVADKHEAHYFANTNSFHSFNTGLSSRNTSAAIIAAPIALYGFGLLKKDETTQSTAMLAGEAAAGAEIVTLIGKIATQRVRPSAAAGSGYGDTWFENATPHWKAQGSFPSGHTTAAFAVATVFAQRYKHHRWVPVVAYGAAAAIGFSRLTTSSHYASDVFVGAALGYSISRFAVLHN